MFYMQYKGREKAAKVVEFVPKWLNLCLSTVCDLWLMRIFLKFRMGQLVSTEIWQIYKLYLHPTQQNQNSGHGWNDAEAFERVRLDELQYENKCGDEEGQKDAPHYQPRN